MSMAGSITYLSITMHTLYISPDLDDSCFGLHDACSNQAWRVCV